MSTIRLKDLTTDQVCDLAFADIKRATVISLTSAQIERVDGTTTTYDLGIDALNRLKHWLLYQTVEPTNKTCPTGTVVTNSEGRAALEDLISHSANFLEALDHRIERAKAEDREEVARLSSSGEQWQGATDANESYWKHERQVFERMVQQSIRALGRTPG